MHVREAGRRSRRSTETDQGSGRYLSHRESGQTVAEIGTYGGNITLVLTDEGVIAVDSKNERIHEDVLAKIKSLTPQP
jgi:hypothetical protein